MNNKKLVFITVTLIFTLVLLCCDTINKRKDNSPVHSALLGTWLFYDDRGFAMINIDTGTIRITVGDNVKSLDAVIIGITPVINTYTDTINYPSGFSLYCKITDKGLVIEDSENGNVARNINDDFTMTVFLSNDQKSLKIKNYNKGNPVLSDIIYEKQR
jgi:hypothetical protein